MNKNSNVLDMSYLEFLQDALEKTKKYVNDNKEDMLLPEYSKYEQKINVLETEIKEELKLQKEEYSSEILSFKKRTKKQELYLEYLEKQLECIDKLRANPNIDYFTKQFLTAKEKELKEEISKINNPPKKVVSNLNKTNHASKIKKAKTCKTTKHRLTKKGRKVIRRWVLGIAAVVSTLTAVAVNKYDNRDIKESSHSIITTSDQSCIDEILNQRWPNHLEETDNLLKHIEYSEILHSINFNRDYQFEEREINFDEIDDMIEQYKDVTDPNLKEYLEKELCLIEKNINYHISSSGYVLVEDLGLHVVKANILDKEGYSADYYNNLTLGFKPASFDPKAEIPVATFNFSDGKESTIYLLNNIFSSNDRRIAEAFECICIAQTNKIRFIYNNSTKYKEYDNERNEFLKAAIGSYDKLSYIDLYTKPNQKTNTH